MEHDPASKPVTPTDQTGGAGPPEPADAPRAEPFGAAPQEGPTLLVARYTDQQSPPEVYRVAADDPATALRDAAELVEQLSRSSGGHLPPIAIQEIVSNLAHAGMDGAVLSLLEGGNTLRVSDRGPGIPDKERALLPGFTTAGPALRSLLRGVGSGLGLARENLAALGGTLSIDDNLGGGTVVTAHVPARPPEATPASATAAEVELGERQLRTLLIILELGPVGPTSVARELKVSASTAYRDLVLLEDTGLVSADGRGLRSATDEGLAYLQTVL